MAIEVKSKTVLKALQTILQDVTIRLDYINPDGLDEDEMKFFDELVQRIDVEKRKCKRLMLKK